MASAALSAERERRTKNVFHMLLSEEIIPLRLFWRILLELC